MFRPFVKNNFKQSRKRSHYKFSFHSRFTYRNNHSRQNHTNQLLRNVFFGIGCGFSMILFIQNYLAKNDNKSPFYWRNSPRLADFMFYTSRHKHLDHLITYSKIFSAAQFDTIQFLTAINTISSWRELKKLFNKLDDLIDDSSPEAILALQEAPLGPQLNPFLLNLLDKNDMNVLNHLVDKNLITKNELYSFGNLFANKLSIQAQLTVAYQNEIDTAKKIALRQQIAKENIEISGIYLALVIHFIKKNTELKKLIDHQEILSYEHLKKIYPVETKAGELMQIGHDIFEFRYDLKQEPVIGKISANYFSAELEAKGLLQKYQQLHCSPERAISYHELPEEIKSLFKDLEHDFKKNTAHIGKIIELIFNSSWKYDRMVGFYERKPR